MDHAPYLSPNCGSRADHLGCAGHVVLSAGEHVPCACRCHEEAPQAPTIVRSLRRSGIRPATVTDLARFEQRMASNTLGSNA